MEEHVEFLLEIRTMIQDALGSALTDRRRFNKKLDALLDAQRRTDASMAYLPIGQPTTEHKVPPLGSAHARLAQAQAEIEQALRAMLESLKRE